MKKMTLSGKRRSPRRRGVARLFVVGAAVAATGTVARPAAAQTSAPDQSPAARRAAPATFRFDISSAPLDTVAAAFTRITGVPVTFAMPELGMIQSPGVSGTMTAEAAMRALLEGTSVSASFATTGATLGVGGVAEFVEVTGAGPAPAGAAARGGPVGCGDPAQGDRRAGRVHAQRRAEKRPGHHAAGG